MKRPASLKGTRLYVDPRTGNYIWRRVDPATGKRLLRSTKTSNLSIALREAENFDLALAGGSKEPRSVALEPLVKDFLTAKECSQDHKDELERYLRRALLDLRLETAADLRLQVVDTRLQELADKRSKKQLRRSYQDVLKGFTKWLAGNHRHLDRDPLAEWEPISLKKEPKRPRRAFSPAEVARAFAAADELDRYKRRKHPQRPIYLALLVAGPRVGALAELDVAALDKKEARLRLGADVGNKKRGAAALDKATLAELTAYVAKREAGPLFLSPLGARITNRSVLPDWLEAFGVGAVQALLPALTFVDAWLVERFLATGKTYVSRGGNPNKVKRKTTQKRDKKATLVKKLGEQIRAEWADRMTGVDVHAFRTTHRTWAEAAGVHPVLIDKQLGHSTPGGAAALEFARSVVASATGKKHYLDLKSSVLDARASAEAVRKILDSAVEALA